jgi:pimeloyl-ACP methyl ester carboxylesterase
MMVACLAEDARLFDSRAGRACGTWSDDCGPYIDTTTPTGETILKKQRLSSGVEIAYYDSGAGTPIVFLHSFGHNKTLWFPQLTHFLEQGYRVVAPDMPGHGDSPFDPSHHTVDAIAESFIELCDKLGLRRAIVAGISMGGYVALRMWARRPGFIAGLVLSNTKAERDSEEILARRRTQIANLRERGLAAFIETGAPRRLSPKTLEQRPWVLDSIKMMNFTVSADANAATLEAMAAKEDDTATLATIDVPTLITSGSDDAFIPKTSAGLLKDGIRHSRLHVIPDTGHVSNLENPAEYNRVMDEFLASLSSTSP